MLEINCNKCENLADKVTGCKLYGANPAAAAKACRSDMFMNYIPRKEKRAKIKPGDLVLVVERDEGEPVNVGGYLFLAHVCGFFIVTPNVYGCSDVEAIMIYHAECTQNDDESILYVFPSGDCYADKEDAKVALEAETGEE